MPAKVRASREASSRPVTAGRSGAPRTSAENLQIVIKISKHCNLRCSYCYEFPELHDRSRMSLPQIERVFRGVRSHLDRDPSIETVTFFWQGGEPFLLPPRVYREIAALSRAVFATARPRIAHAVQTNLTAVSPAWLAFLEERSFFDDIGVSFDAVGDCRVDTRGRLRTDLVLTNLQKLIDAGLPFGAIAVVSRQTLPDLRQVHRFYDEAGIEARYLPFNQSSSLEQSARHALTGAEIVGALTDLFDAWMASDTATAVEPLREYLGYALNVIDGARTRSDLASRESVFVVNTDGTVWGTADLYEPAAAYGNLFEQDLTALLASDARRRALERANDRMQAVCGACPFAGACPGYLVAFGFPIERASIRTSEDCPVRHVVAHILARLRAGSGVGGLPAHGPGRGAQVAEPPRSRAPQARS